MTVFAPRPVAPEPTAAAPLPVRAVNEGNLALQPAPSPRALPVDAMRGGVVALMVFVNYLGEMAGAPAWTQHLPASVDGYSLTDLVFPWFLFLVGVSIPLSLGGVGLGRAAARVIPRVTALALLGVVLASKEQTNAAATGMNRHLWVALTLTAVVVLCRVAPVKGRAWALRGVAAVGLLVLLLVWRGDREGGGVGPLASSWWGMLGIIGWVYLVGATAYVGARGRATALVGVMGLLVCVSIGTRLGRLGPLRPLEGLFEVPAIFGSLPVIVVAGIVAGGWSRQPRRLVLFGAGLWAAGWFLRPLHGYHKEGATAAWALVAAGQGTLLLAGLGRLLERWQPAPARWLGLAGANALLAYLLPEWLEAVSQAVDIDLMPGFEVGGATGMANAAALTLVVVAVAALATRRGLFVRV